MLFGIPPVRTTASLLTNAVPGLLRIVLNNFLEVQSFFSRRVAPYEVAPTQSRC